MSLCKATNTSTSSGASKRSRRGKPKSSSHIITRSQFLGGKLVPPTDPPSTEQNPWNSIVIVQAKKGLTSAWEVKVSDIADYLVDQLDTSDDAKRTIFRSLHVPLDIKVSRVFFWNMNGKSIAIGAYNLTAGSTQDVICDMIDTQSQDSYPRVGYRWPLQMQQVTLSNNIDKPSHVVTVFAPDSSDILMHCHIHWKSSVTPTSPYNVLSGLTSLHRTTMDIATTMRTHLGVSKETFKVDKGILKKMPATVFGVVPVAITPASTTADAHHPSFSDDNVLRDSEDCDHYRSPSYSEFNALREEIESLRCEVHRAVSVTSSTSIL